MASILLSSLSQVKEPGEMYALVFLCPSSDKYEMFVATMGEKSIKTTQLPDVQNVVVAFAQFGSDLDASTQQLLNRGSKLTELLKQKQYSPMTVAEQVISVFCGVKGYLDDIDLKDIAEFENKIIERCKSDKPELIESIQSSVKLEEAIEKSLIDVITNLKKNFKS